MNTLIKTKTNFAAATFVSFILLLCSSVNLLAQTFKWSGNVDASIQNSDTGTTSLSRAGDGNLSTSRLRLDGTSPDLGGIKFDFALEGGLRSNSGTLGSTTTTGQTFSREASVGVSGSLGTVRLGKTDLSQAEGMDTLAYTFGNFTNFALNGTALEIGSDLDNVVSYRSPSMGGLTVWAGMSNNANGATTDANTNQQSASVAYNAGQLKIGAGYGRKDATTEAGKTDATSLGVSYTLPQAILGVAHIRGDNSTTGDVESSSNIYSVRVPLKDGLNLHGVFYQSKDGSQATANTGQGYTVGVSKLFSTSATVYAAYSKVDNDANSSMYTNGMTAPSAGKDPSLFLVGVNYAF